MGPRMARLVSHPATLPVLAGVAGVVNGGLVGYLSGRRSGMRDAILTEDPIDEAREDPNQLKLDLEQSANQEEGEVISFDRSATQATIDRGADLVKNDPDHPAVRAALGMITRVDPDDEGDLTVEAVLTDEGMAVAEEAAEVYEAHGPRASSIFESPWGEWDYPTQEAQRGERDPYTIHKDEFEANESKLRQTALTYYAGDNIMVDEDGVVVPNYPDITGNLQFGHGSRNEDMVYVRNPRLDAEYEITRSYDSYVHAVYGMVADMEAEHEIRHSRDPIRRMRQDD